MKAKKNRYIIRLKKDNGEVQFLDERGIWIWPDWDKKYRAIFTKQEASDWKYGVENKDYWYLSVLKD